LRYAEKQFMFLGMEPTKYLLTATTADNTVHTAIDGKTHDTLASALSSYTRYAKDCRERCGWNESSVRSLSITRKIV